jgi:hypothetical protein
MHPFYWYFALFISTILAFGGGFQFVRLLRKKCKSERKIRYFTTTIFLAPVIVYLFFSLLVLFGVFDRTVSDCIAFGTVSGILVQLAYKPTGSGSIKLRAKQVDGKHVDVWLDSTESNVGEVRNKIAEEMTIQPARVCIESGKGTFLDDMNQKFFETIDDGLKKTDFFGHLNCNCYIFVKEEEKKKYSATTPKEDEDVNERDANKGILSGILHKPEIKFGEFLVCSARIARNQDAKVNFQVSFIDKFVAAAPTTLQLNSTTIRVHPWLASDDLKENASQSTKQQSSVENDATVKSQIGEDGAVHAPPPPNHDRTHSINSADAFSDAGESVISSAARPSLLKKMRRGTISLFKSKELQDYFGKPIHNGDIVVLETSGK